MDKKPIPKEVEENGWWFWREDNTKMWELDIPIEEMKIDDLEWIFAIPFWEDEEGNFTITPNDFMEDMEKFPSHKKRVDLSDTSYPIDIMRNRKGRWMTLDGLHRLVKMKLQGVKIVKVRKIPHEMIPLIEN